MDKYKILKEYEQNLIRIENIIGDGSTNNIQLNTLGKYLFGNKFKGVYSSNEMPNIKNNEMYIVNNKKSNQNGEHWIGVYKYKNKLYMYDTFNRPIRNLSNYFTNKHIINANNDTDQSKNESNCGSRVISWLISFHNYKDKIINII